MVLEQAQEPNTWLGGKRILWLLLVVIASIFRGAIIFRDPSTLASDPDAYGAMAKCWAQTGTFGLLDATGDAVASAYRPPLYPWLLSWCIQEDGDWSKMAVGALHLIMGVTTCCLTFSLAKRHFASGIVAWIIAVLVAVDPILLQQSSLLMTETLATLLAVSCLELLSRWQASLTVQDSNRRHWNDWGWAIGLGLLLGSQTLCRPTALLWTWIFLLTLPLLLHKMPKIWVRGWAILCLCSLMVTAAWTARNYQQFGTPIIMTSHGGYTLLLANNHELYDHLQIEPVSRHWNPQRFHAEWLQSLRPADRDALSELEQDSLANRLALQTIRERPAMFAWSCCVRLGWLWAWWPAIDADASNSQSSDTSPRTAWQRIAIGIWYAWWETLALGGLLLWASGKSPFSRRDVVIVCAWLLPLSLTLVHAIFWSNMRMRAPAMPVVYCFSGLMISQLGNRFRQRGRPSEGSERQTTKQYLDPLLRWSVFAGLLLWNGIPCQAQTWDRLPDLPNKIGVAGPYVGKIDGMLIVAGGANFPGKPPWEGGTKVWHDEIYGWSPGNLEWKLLGHLPQASAYGVSVSTPQGMICVGGSTASDHLRSCYQLRLEKDRMAFESLPDLPISIANGCGALLDGVLYLAGGQETPGSQMALASFWALDLNQHEAHWKMLASWPGPPRILGLAGVLQDSFLLMGGAELEGVPNQTTKRRYLKDAYVYRPSHGWDPLPELPWSIVAAPSPALTLDPFTLLILGGDDGSLLETDPRHHPGFPKRTLLYHARERTWEATVPPPIARVTTQTTILDGHWVIPSGETRPGVRSAEVWSVKIPETDHR